MKEWLRAVLVNAPAVLLLAIVFSSVYLTATGKDIPELFLLPRRRPIGCAVRATIVGFSPGNVLYRDPSGGRITHKRGKRPSQRRRRNGHSFDQGF